MANSDSECNLRRCEMPAQTPDLTVAVQDYLKAIYALESAGERVTTSALARRMGVSAPSATAMTKRLDELGLVERVPLSRSRAHRRRAARRPRGASPPSTARALPRRPARALARRGARGGGAARARALRGARGEDRRGARIPDPRSPRRPDPRPRAPRRAGRPSHAARSGARRARIGRRAFPTATPSCSATSASSGSCPARDLELVAYAPFGGPVTVRTTRGEHAISRELADRIAAA